MLILFSVLSFAVFLAACFSFLYKRKKIYGFLNGSQTFIIGLFISATLFYIPYYLNVFLSEQILERVGKALLMSVHHAISIFVVALNFEEVYTYASGCGFAGAVYACYGAFLFVVAPLATFGFIFTYLGNFNAYLQLLTFPNRKAYVFSELNNYTIALATDIRKKERKSILIFTDVPENAKSSATEEAKSIHARCIKADILTFHSKTLKMKNNITYVLLNEKEAENLSDVYSMINAEQTKTARDVYVCLNNDSVLSEFRYRSNMRIMRFDKVHSLVLSIIEKTGKRIFEKVSEKSEKTIKVLLVGMGRIGTQFAKTLSWYTAVEGYKTEVYAFDMSDTAKARFMHMCPGFFDENTASDYSISIYDGCLSGTSDFDEKVREIGEVDYAFICLGDDELNINTAYDVRSLISGENSKTVIQTVVSNICKGRMLQENRSSGIEFISDVETMYSYDVFFAPDKKQKMAEYNMQWMSKDCNIAAAYESLSNEANFKSSESFVMSDALYDSLGITGEKKKMSEHRRWINFLCADGYKYGENRDKIRKTHPMMIPWSKLPEEFKERI